MTTLAPRPAQVRMLQGLPLWRLTKLHTWRRNALARMQEHGMPQVVVDKQEQLVAEAAEALRSKGVL